MFSIFPPEVYNTTAQGSFPYSMQRLLVRSKARGTLRGYSNSITSWFKFAKLHNFPTNPASVFGVTRFITELVKLFLSGAKREAAERRGPVKKAPVLSQDQIHKVVDTLWTKGVGIIDRYLSLSTWRTVVRICMMYKTLCRNDCYSELLTSDVIFEEDHIQISFARAKNDKFYQGSISILSCVSAQPRYCPKVILVKYFEVMGFKQESTEFLNCRLRYSKQHGIVAIPHLPLAYSTSLTESKNLCHSLGFEGNFSEKSYKVAGVTQGFDAGLTTEEMMYHGRWKSLETPNVYYS